jgi:hypothetical protein
MKNKITILVLCFLILGGLKNHAHACSCGRPPLVQNYNDADVIVFGTVTKVEERTRSEKLPNCDLLKDEPDRLKSPFHSCQTPAWWKGHYYTVQVDQSWKLGNIKTLEVVHIPQSLCGISLGVKKKSLIYLYKSQIGWTSGVCSITRLPYSQIIEIIFLDAIENKSTTTQTLKRMADYLTPKKEQLENASVSPPPTINTESERVLQALSKNPKRFYKSKSLELLQYLVGHNLVLEYLLFEKFQSLPKPPPSADNVEKSQTGLRNILKLALATSRLEKTQDIIYPKLLDQFKNIKNEEEFIAFSALQQISNPNKVIPRLKKFLEAKNNFLLNRRARWLLKDFEARPPKKNFPPLELY